MEEREIKIAWVDIDELIPYDKKLKHNDDVVDAVEKSIREFGFRIPCTITLDKAIITGDVRVRAAKRAGMRRVPCIYESDLTPEQAKAYRLVDNKCAELGEWDYQALSVELGELADLFDMSQFGFEVGGKIDWDDIPDLSEQSYDKPEKVMLKCPCCGHVDSTTHFIQVEAGDENIS